jgi:hypothetical protein
LMPKTAPGLAGESHVRELEPTGASSQNFHILSYKS